MAVEQPIRRRGTLSVQVALTQAGLLTATLVFLVLVAWLSQVRPESPDMQRFKLPVRRK